MKKLKMTAQTLIFEDGCNKYLEYYRQRNLRQGTINQYRQGTIKHYKRAILIVPVLSVPHFINKSSCFFRNAHALRHNDFISQFP